MYPEKPQSKYRNKGEAWDAIWSKLKELVPACTHFRHHEFESAICAVEHLDERRRYVNMTDGTLIDWIDPDILSKLVWQDGTPHDFDFICCINCPGERPVVLRSEQGWISACRFNGSFADGTHGKLVLKQACE